MGSNESNETKQIQQSSGGQFQAEGALSWEELAEMSTYTLEPVDGPTSSQAVLRLFGQSEADVRVILYRDNHAWCPYCQKVWLWLEEMQVPYRVKKVTMFCYGEKETWYRRKVPSGMLPALELDGKLITESDDILVALEAAFGPLTFGMTDPSVVPMRKLERLLFRAWCAWLCYPVRSQGDDDRARAAFEATAAQVEAALAQTAGPYLLQEFSTADVVFTPYVERMNASLFYYKGFTLRCAEARPRLSAWFDAMESRATYRGTQSDFHTHVHDLPPQMGGCYANNNPLVPRYQAAVDCCFGSGGALSKAAAAAAAANGASTASSGPSSPVEVPEARYPEPPHSSAEALAQVLRHRQRLVTVNPVGATALVDCALRCALTRLMTGKAVAPPVVATPRGGADVALRYLRDRVSVPRDMSLYAARRLRQALEDTAALAGTGQGPALTTRHRRDQNPVPFQTV